MAARDSPIQHDADNALQKPDKPVSCPRCDSLETKFCYFNNYNVKQPRHFCKNCQRYWTAGGTLRNVPIGAGRRKNKNCATSGKPHSEVVIPRSDHPDAAQRLHSDHNLNHANLIAVTSDPGLDMIESSQVTSSFPSLRQQQFYSSSAYLPSAPPTSTAIESSAQESVRGSSDYENASRGAKVPGADEIWRVSPISAVENEDSTLCSSVTALSSSSDGVSVSNLEEGTAALSNMAGEEGFANLTAIGWGGAALPLALPLPYMAWPGAVADSFFPWTPVFTPLCTPVGWGVPSNFGWNASAAASTTGKRQRSPAEQQGSLCVPKTLRIDHPEEAAQSSILATLGFGSVSTAQSRPSTGFCNAFQPKAEVFQPKAGVRVSDQLLETQHLHTNPAAQARSIAFQEGS